MTVSRAILIVLSLAVAPWALADEATLRRPIAVHPLDEQRVVVANRVGSISVVDTATSKVQFEERVAANLSSLAALSPGRYLATDEQSHKLLLIEANQQTASVVADHPVAKYPVNVAATNDGSRCAVASLWSRQVTICAIQTDKESAQLRAENVIDLAFAPRQQIVLPGDKQLLVFDSFGGRLAVVELATGKFVLQRDFPGHAVRGLVLSPDKTMLLAAHQMLNPFAQGTQSDMHWGLLMSNDLRWMKLTSLLDPKAEIYAGGQVHPCGVPGRGGGDPAGVAITSQGTIVVCLGGVNQVMVGTKSDISLEPIPVGKRPTAVAVLSDKSAVVANTFEDSLSIVDLTTRKVTKTISLGATRQRTVLERGEELFFDASFSHEGWMSCHSCHTDGHSNFTRNDNLSDGGFGAPKLVLSLLGRKDTAPFAWNAGMATLRDQVSNSIHKTMQTDRKKISGDDVAAITAYVESLPSPPGVDEARGTVDSKAVGRGRQIFERHECSKCHSGKTFTSSSVEDGGIKDEQGRTQFNPPSLRGVGQRDALFHDGRATTLDGVFLKHGHPLGQSWSDDEVRDLIAYLRSL